jgi:hypothetical protein
MNLQAHLHHNSGSNTTDVVLAWNYHDPVSYFQISRDLVADYAHVGNHYPRVGYRYVDHQVPPGPHTYTIKAVGDQTVSLETSIKVTV